MDHLPWHVFRRCVARYDGDHKIKHFSCLDQYRCMAFAQLTFRESLRDIEACLRAQAPKLYHLGFRASDLSQHAGQRERGARLADLCRLRAASDRHRAQAVYQRTLWRRLKDWTRSTRWTPRPSICACRCSRGRRFAPPRRRSSCTRCSICAAISRLSSISATAKCTMSTSSTLVPEAGAFYVMDRGYIDFATARLDRGGQLLRDARQSATWMPSAVFASRRSTTGLICDQTIVLTGIHSRQGFDPSPAPRPVQRSGNDKRLVFLTNNFALPALTIAGSTNAAGRWNCFSNGSNSICASKHSSARPRTRSKTQIWIGDLGLRARRHHQKTPRHLSPACTKCYRF